MKNKKLELVYVRAIICTSIVLTHILTSYTIQEATETVEYEYLYIIRNIFIFGVPCFLILSQLLVTARYDYIPYNFIRKRIVYVFIPYFFVGILYAYTMKYGSDESFIEIYKDAVIIGNWYGYFIIIFLFTILLNLLFKRIPLKIFGNIWVLFSALIVQVVFFYVRNHYDWFQEFLIHDYPLNEHTFFLGWIFYYFLGGFIGCHYEKVIKFLEDYLVIVIAASILAFVIFVMYFNHDYYTVQSFAGKLIPYNTMMFFLVLGIAIHCNTIAYSYVVFVSHFSYQIYLLHPLYLNSVYDVTRPFVDSTLAFIFITLFVVQTSIIGFSIFVHTFSVTRILFGTRDFKYIFKEIDAKYLS